MKRFFVICALLSISTAAFAGPTFATSTLAVSPTGTTVQAVVGDVNGDGQNDLVVLSGSSLRVYSVTANGGATLQQSVAVTSAPAGWAYAQPRIADVDGDGDRDVALYLRSDGQPGFLQLVKWEQASSSFSVAGPYTMPEADAAYSCDIADIDGDGIPDAITANRGVAAPETIFVTSGASGFTSSVSYPFPSNAPGISFVYARDLDADGRADVAVSTAPFNTVAARIFYNRNGALTLTQDLIGEASLELGFGDQNNDGRVDIVVTNNHTNNIRIYRGAQYTTQVGFAVPPDPRTPVVGDFSGDGLADVAMAMPFNKNLTIILGRLGSTAVGSPELTAADFRVDSNVQILASGDLDNDGRLDLIFATDRVIWIRAVPDVTAPVMTVPSSVNVEATSALGAKASWTAFAIDAEDGGVGVTCTPASGSQFALGATKVSCTAKDFSNNVSNASFVVTVRDTKAPVITVPANISAAATSATGAAVTFTATATDIVSGSVAVQCTPASGSVFAVGTTAVNCTARDTAGNVANRSFNVTITGGDTAPPVLSLPASFAVEATSPNGAIASWAASAIDAHDGAVAVQCAPASGSLFAIGTSTVTCSAADAAGNAASGSFDVTVSDTTAPAIASISATPNVLGPSNHKMIPVSIRVTASDTGDSAPVARIRSVSSNEPDNGLGDGDTANDWTITGPLTVSLRAERAGNGRGRIYTIVVDVTDRFGNRSSAAVLVTVSK